MFALDNFDALAATDGKLIFQVLHYNYVMRQIIFTNSFMFFPQL